MTDIRDNKSVAARELDVFRHYMMRSINGAETNLLESTITSRHFVVRVDLVPFWEDARNLDMQGKGWDLTTLCNGSLMKDDAKRFNEITAEQVVVGDIAKLEAVMRANAARCHAQRETRKIWSDIGTGEIDAETAPARFEAAAGMFSDCVESGATDNLTVAGRLGGRMIAGKSDVELLPMPLLGAHYNGWRTGKLYVIGAMTSQHKTTVCLDACTELEKAGFNSLYFTLEDDKEDLVTRQIVQESDGGITMDDAVTGIDKRGPKTQILVEAINAIESRPGRVFIDDSKGLRIDAICARISKSVAKNGIKAAVVDFLQRIVKDDPRQPVHEFYEQCSAQLADLAHRLKIVIFLAVQFTQEATKKIGSTEGKDKLPQIGDIKGGSGIAQNAFGVWLNYMPPDQFEDDTVVVKDMFLCIRKWKSANPRVFRATVEGRKFRIRLNMGKGNGMSVIDGGAMRKPNRSAFYGSPGEAD